MTPLLLSVLLLTGIAASSPSHSSITCILRGGAADRAELWTPEEDQRLLELQSKLGKKWKEISVLMGNRRSSKGCSARFKRITASPANSTTGRSMREQVQQVGGDAAGGEVMRDTATHPKTQLRKKPRTKPEAEEKREDAAPVADVAEESPAEEKTPDTGDKMRPESTAKRALPHVTKQKEDASVEKETTSKKRRIVASSSESEPPPAMDQAAQQLEEFGSKIENLQEEEEAEQEATTEKASRDEIDKSVTEEAKPQDAWADLNALREESALRKQKIQSMWDVKTHAGKRTGFHIKLPSKKKKLFGYIDGKKVKLVLYPAHLTSQDLKIPPKLSNETQEEDSIRNQTFTDKSGRLWVFQREIENELEFAQVNTSAAVTEQEPPSTLNTRSLPKGWETMKPKEKRRALREQANAFLLACVEKYSNSTADRLRDEKFRQLEVADNCSISPELVQNLTRLSNISDCIPPPMYIYPPHVMSVQKRFQESGRYHLHHFMTAAKEGNISVLYKLRHYAGSRDKMGWTGLHYAVLFGRREAARFLMRCGLSYMAENFQGLSPCDIAELYKTGREKDVRYYSKIHKIFKRTLPSLCPRPGQEDFQDVALKKKSANSRHPPMLTTSNLPRRVAVHENAWDRENTVDLLGPNALRRAEFNFYGSETGFGEYKLTK